MADICFFVDDEIGHLMPTLGLARMLADNGHTVCYMGIADHRATVDRYGIRYYTIFEDIYPEGCLAAYRKALQSGNSGKPRREKPHLMEILSGRLDKMMAELEPDMLIMTSFLSVEALILSKKYGTQVVLFTPYFPDLKNSDGCLDVMIRLSAIDAGRVIGFLSEGQMQAGKNLKDLFLGIDSFPELIACPAELQISDPGIREKARYIGPCIRPPIADLADEIFKKIEPGKKIVYVSMGSQTALFAAKAAQCIDLVIDTIEAEGMEDCVFIVAAGARYRAEGRCVPQNLLLLDWAPQAEILQRADLALIHGGLGAVKECIFFGVPMLVYPVMRDGPENANRVVFHNIGLKADLGIMTPPQLKQSLYHLLEDDGIGKNIRAFQHLFRDYEDRKCGVAEINKLLKIV
jgi:MGT family glycosyltransferase